MKLVRIIYSLRIIVVTIPGLAITSPLPGWAQPQGSFTILDVHGATATAPSGVNDAGQVVGNYTDAAGGGSFLWAAGSFTIIHDPSGQPAGPNAFINNAGQVAGYNRDTQLGQLFRWTVATGTFSTVDAPGTMIMKGINDAGQVVGYYDEPPPANKRHGFLWSADGLHVLDYPGAFTYTELYGINNVGQIVGAYDDSTVTGHAFLWTSGNFTTIQGPRGSDFAPLGINDVGQVVGNYTDVTEHGFLWTTGNFSTIDGPNATVTVAVRINNVGQIIGGYRDLQGSHGYVWTAGSLRRLYGPNGLEIGASWINNVGQIVGSYVDSAGTHGFLCGLPCGDSASLSIGDASGPFAGTTTLSATLLTGAPASGKPITFSLFSNSIGSAMTDTNGVATLANVSLNALRAGAYPTAIQASFAGDATVGPATGNGSLTVTQAIPTLNWPLPAAIAFCTPLGTTQLDATTNIQGTFAYMPPAGTMLKIGVAEILSVTFTPTDMVDYTTARATASITVTKATPTTSVTGPPSSNHGQMVTFSTHVSASCGTPSGIVWFLDGDTIVSTSSLDADGNALFSTSTLSVGKHAISVWYQGTYGMSPDDFYPSQSGVLTHTVAFALPLTVSLVGSGTGMVTSTPTGIRCGVDCVGFFANGARVTLQAVAGRQSTFTSWSGCDKVTGQLCTVSLAAPRAVSATFSAALRRSDITVFRPSNGGWYILQSSANYTTYVSHIWGLTDDIPVRGDFDGDGNEDIAVYRPSNGGWYLLLSSSDYTEYVSYLWGAPGDIPETGDYDGDGRTDIAIYRPSSGTWYILLSSSGYTTYVSQLWGLTGDVPVPGDYDGDGKTDIAMYRPSNGAWYTLQSSTNSTTYLSFMWGVGGDIPAAADYDGDGKVDPAVYRPANGGWYFLRSSTNYTTYGALLWGLTGDTPVVGDFDGDGKSDIAIYRSSSGGWYILQSSTSYATYVSYLWGLAGDVPLLKRP